MIQSEPKYMIPGFLANGIHTGIKEQRKKDLSLIYSTVPAKAAAVFTTNAFKAAPVLLDMERISSGLAQAILTNSGNANAAMGRQGYEDAKAMSSAVSEKLNIKDDLVLVASTGVIGHHLPISKIQAGIPRLVRGLKAEGIEDAEQAIMTTDRFPKISIRKGRIGNQDITLCGIAKGAGMIEPHMATMLAYVMTDANVDGAVLNKIFRETVDRSLNAISVDGCMSTNDTAIILANGAAGNRVIKGRRDTSILRDLLGDVLSELSRAMVRDGEGATKTIRIDVREARTLGEAKKIAYAVANSNLFKTACFGGDPNWGRIISAIGSAGIALHVDAVEVSFDDVVVFKEGCGTAGNSQILQQIMKKDELSLNIQLGLGNHSFCMHTSDLTYDYVKINAHYHT